MTSVTLLKEHQHFDDEVDKNSYYDLTAPNMSGTQLREFLQLRMKARDNLGVSLKVPTFAITE